MDVVSNLNEIKFNLELNKGTIHTDYVMGNKFCNYLKYLKFCFKNFKYLKYLKQNCTFFSDTTGTNYDQINCLTAS